MTARACARVRSVFKPAILGPVTVLAFCLCAPARAEAPLTVDGAETEQPGAFEFAAQIFLDGSLRGGELEVGYVPIENIEVGLELGAAEDRDTSPRARETEYGLAVKWVPQQSGEGISWGVKAGFGREIEDDRQGQKEETDQVALTGVFSYAIHRGPIVHLNLGVAHEKLESESDTFFIWGLGTGYRFARRFTATAEIYGEQHRDPAIAFGLRYKLGGNASLFARVGRQDEDSFGGIGVAFEIEPN